MSSIWTKDCKFSEFGTLKKDIKTDVLIIGGGIAGILCAYMLKNKGVDCVVAEAERIASGTTKNTTAKISAINGLICDKMIYRFGTDTAKLYMKAQAEAVEMYRKLTKNIDCDFEEHSSYVYSSDTNKIQKGREAFEKLGISYIFEKSIPFEIKAAGAIGLKNQAQFNPLKFLFEIAKGINIYENTRVLEIRPDCVITNKGKIKAEKIIVATHFPFLNKHGSYFLKMYQHRSYVIAYENVPNKMEMYVDDHKKGMSFRSYNGKLLVGGGGHRTGKKGGGWREIFDFMHKNYPQAQEVCRWAAQDCITLDDMPYIGQYSKNTPNLFVATGFNKWGITNSMISALVLSDMILDKENQYSEIFSPSRNILRPRLAINATEALVSLLTPTKPRCPHMGCSLKYNPYEHSWDCPCHGSRFEKNGKLIDNPATDDLFK